MIIEVMLCGVFFLSTHILNYGYGYGSITCEKNSYVITRSYLYHFFNTDSEDEERVSGFLRDASDFSPTSDVDKIK